MVETHTSPIWMAALVAASILFSFALACGMPFAALSALAALTLPMRNAFKLAGLGWLANQAIGFGFLGYPLDVMTMAWGVALGVSALAAVAAARWMIAHTGHTATRLVLVFGAGWLGQQATVFLASLILGSTASGFAPSVVWFIFWTNALAFGLLLACQLAGARIGVARSPLTYRAG